MAAAAAAGSSTPRPSAPATSVSDRIERSPELQQRVAELKQELDRRTQASAEHVAEVHRQVIEAKDASHETVVRAALAILHGELYFLESS